MPFRFAFSRLRARRALERSQRAAFTLLEWLVLGPILVVLIVIALAARYLYHVLFFALCSFQDFLSLFIRGLNRTDNTGNRAAQLPEEVQLQIFHLLRTRARFGSAAVHITPGPYSDEGYKPRPQRDLAAARLVCEGWYYAATTALYTDVTLCTPLECVVFANTLVSHPRLAQHVRRLRLPPLLWQLSCFRTPAELQKRIPKYGCLRWLELQSAAIRLSVQCSAVEDVTICGASGLVGGMVEQLRRSSRLAHLSCNWSGRFIEYQRSHRYLDVSYVASRLRCLESLTVSRYFIVSSATHALHALHTLRLEKCYLNRIWLPAFLAHLPNLRSLDWRRSCFRPNPDREEITAAELFGDQASKLVTCVLFDHDHHTGWFGLIVKLNDMAAFASLRTLNISDHMLQSLTQAPPYLVELVITFCNHSLFRNTARHHDMVFDVAECLKDRMPLRRGWRSPSLQAIGLWDQIPLSLLRKWSVVSFLLRDFLKQCGADLTVNLTLNPLGEAILQDVFTKQEHIRRLLWKDVI